LDGAFQPRKAASAVQPADHRLDDCEKQHQACGKAGRLANVVIGEQDLHHGGEKDEKSQLPDPGGKRPHQRSSSHRINAAVLPTPTTTVTATKNIRLAVMSPARSKLMLPASPERA